ncbi:MAG: toxic anion resistance protein [Sarcina sp.]
MINFGNEENNNSIDVEFENDKKQGEMNNSNTQTNFNNNDFNKQNQHMNNSNQQMQYNQNMNNYNQNSNNGYQNQQMNNGQNNGYQNQQMGYGQNVGYQDQQAGYGQNNGYQNPQMNYDQNSGYQNPQMGYGQNNGYQNQQMNYGSQQQNNNQQAYQNQFAQQQSHGINLSMNSGDTSMAPQGEMAMEEITENMNEYKQRLRAQRDVQALTNEVNIQDTTSIINFGQRASDNISKISDELLNSMKSVKAEEAGEMLGNLTKIMDKFDVKELEDNKPSMFSKMFKNMGNSVAKLFQKYDTMGYEVQKVYVLLKKYENDIREANTNLKKLYDGNLEYYRQLEKYIVAGEMAIEEVDMYLQQIPNDQSMNPEEKQMLIQKLEVSRDMLSQRVYDLQIAETVAIQAAPMIQTIQMSNFNLMRKINSSFIITLPIFKQCLAQAVILKRQEIQAKSIKQLDDKTNELILRNATNTARQSVEIAKLSSGSSVQIETLQKSFETIMKGIEDTKTIQESNKQQRKENSFKLEQIKANMKKNISQI